MTHEESQWLIRHKKKSQLELGYILIIGLLCMSAMIVYGI